MNHSMAVFLISDQARAVLVTYEPDPDNNGRKSDRTMYKTLDQAIKVGDYVVVPTDTRHKMTVCKIVEADVEPDFDSAVELKWIVGTVNTVDFDKIKSQEGDAIAKIKSAEKRRKREELAKDLMADAGNDLKKLPIYSSGEQAS